MFLHSNKTNFYKEIRAGSDDHSHRARHCLRRVKGQIEASDFALAPQINPRGVCDRAHPDIRSRTPKRLNQ